MSKRIVDETTTSSVASDDYLIMDGSTNGSRKITPDNLVANTTTASTLTSHISDANDAISDIQTDIETNADAIATNTSDISSLQNAIELLETGSLSATTASIGNMPIADGNGGWSWDDLANSFYEEITYTKERYNDATDCYFVEIPLTDTDGDVIMPYMAYHSDLTPLEYAQENGTTLTTNGSIALLSESSTTIRANIISGGEVIDGSDVTESLVPNACGYIGFSEDRATVTEYDITTTASTMISDGVYLGFPYYYKLVEDSAVVDNSATTDNEGTVAGEYNPRLAIGVLSDNTILIAACDGRTDIDVGLTVDELAEIMLDKGCVNAWHMDGGGSTNVTIKGSKLNRNIDDDGITDRAIARSFNVKKSEQVAEIVETMSKIGEEKQNIIQQIIPAVNYIQDEIEQQYTYLSRPNLNDLDYAFNGYVTNATNYPSSAAKSSGYVINIIRSDNTAYRFQTFCAYSEDVIYFRRCSNGTWGSWLAIATTS